MKEGKQVIDRGALADQAEELGAFGND